MASFDGKRSLTINIAKSEEGNAMVLAKRVKGVVTQYKERYPDISFGTFSDTSIYIQNRLNTVISNIMFGLILVGLSMYLLINKRISFVVIVGVPTSFVLSLIVLEQAGYSINMMSLLGALIAIGVIVDDAIIVAENIQRHIEEGMQPKDAAYAGAKEVVGPVFAASFTTVFAFIPMLMMTGEMGIFIEAIPVAISVLIGASLLESFIFLPIHARHVLKSGDREVNWEPLQRLYIGIVKKLIHYRKTTLAAFWIGVPVLIVVGFTLIKFQLFPTFDASNINVSGKLPVNTTLEETFEVAQAMEQEILKLKEQYAIETVTVIAGFRMDTKGQGESGKHLFHIFVDLYKAKPENFVEKYVTPYLSFDYDPEGRIREIPSFTIETRLQKDLEKFVSLYSIDEFAVRGARAGVVQSAIEISVVSDNDQQSAAVIRQVESELRQIPGVHSIGNDAQYGVPEIKLKVNRYGEMLGVTEGSIAREVGYYFREGTQAKSFDDEGIVEIVILDKRKNYFETLKNFRITLADGRKIALSDVVDFITVQNFQQVNKEDGRKRRSVYADVDTATVTAEEVIKKIQPILKSIEAESGSKIELGGEREANEQLAQEMTMAATVAMFLMFMTLLIMLLV